MLPVIAAEVFTLRPDFRALSIAARNVVNTTAPAPAAALCAEPWAATHLESWREAYRAFGAKPQRTPSSAEALLKRVTRDGALPPINAVVDLYNAVSLAFAIPVGGEDMSAYEGAPHLVRATGTEVFDTMQNGAPAIEYPEAGEVIWRDAKGITCRRWNWRQGTRTRIETHSTQMWFVLEALDPLPHEALLAAGRMLTQGLASLSPACTLETHLLSRSGAHVVA